VGTGSDIKGALQFVQGKTSPTTTFKIQALESLDFSWDPNDAQWKQHLSELVEFRKEHQHCNVPAIYSKNNSNWEVGLEPKGRLTICTERHRLL
jgi:hypothetical protein